MKTFQEIKTAMRSFIRGKNTLIDLSEGSIVDDIVISAPSQEIAKLYEENNITSQGQSLETSSDLATDSLGKNIGILRLSSRSASGTVKFFTFNAPTNDITISVGTIISTYATNGAESIQFVVTSTVYMYAQLAASYLNVTKNVYEVSASIEALKSGLDGIVGPQAVTQLVTVIPGIDGVYNDDSTAGGADSESTNDLKIRIADKWRGNSIGVADGYLSETLAYPGVEDAIVVGGADTGRDDLGPVDIFIRGKKITPVQDSFIAYTDYPDLILSRQPVIDSETISVITNLGGVLSPSLYTLTKDTGVYAGSVRGQDNVHWIYTLPTSSGSVVVSYSYNSLIYDLQNYFLDPSRNVQNIDLLVKWATEIKIDITCSIRITPGYDSNSVISEISTQLALFFNDLSIGSLIQQSEVAETILLVAGVDDLQLPLTLFQGENGSVTVDSFGNLQLLSKSYAVIGDLIINVV